MLKTEQPVPRAKTLDKRPERIAWAITLTGFAIFCLITAASGMLGYRWWTRPTIAPISVEVQQQLAVQVQRAGLVRLEVLTDNQLNPGDRIMVIKESTPGPAAKLRFGSATVALWAGTDLLIGPFGRQWNDPTLATARFNLKSGQVQVDITDDDQTVVLEAGSSATPIVLERGRYRVRLLDPNSPTTAMAERADGRGLEVAVERGQAYVGNTTVRPGMLLQEVANKQSPRLTTWQLIRDGDFQQLVNDFNGQPGRVPSPWRRNVEATVEGARSTGQVRPTQNCVDALARTDCEQPYVRFVRMGGNDRGFSTAIQQQVEADVSAYQEVRLSAEIKIVWQSLSKAGETGTECPLLARVKYMNNEGQNLQMDYCYWAFEHAGRTGVTSNLPYIKTRQLQPNTWYPLDVDLKQELPGLVKIQEISFQANGHDYESLVSNVRLTAGGLADINSAGPNG